MANSVDYASPSVSRDKGYHSRSSLTCSPSLWSSLRSRFDTLPDQLNAEEMERTRRLKEEAKLLSKGFSSTSPSLPVLRAYAAIEGSRDLTRQPTLTELVHVSVTERSKTDNDDELDKRGSKRKLDFSDREVENSPKSPDELKKKPKKAKIAAPSDSDSELRLMQERCSVLEEENSRLKNGLLGIISVDEEDDLVRLQLEELLADKSRLAYENAKLARENKWLHQLVEYHQKVITSQGPPSLALRMSL